MAVIQQVQITVKDFGRKGLIEIELTIVRTSKARRHALTHRRVLSLFLENRNLINTRNIVHSESMACYSKQASQRGELKKVFMPGSASVSEQQVFCAYNH